MCFWFPCCDRPLTPCAPSSCCSIMPRPPLALSSPPRSFAALWYNTQPTSAMIIHYTGPGGSGAGTAHTSRLPTFVSPARPAVTFALARHLRTSSFSLVLAGTNHRLRMTWNNNKFQLYNFNNHVLDDCRNLDTGTVWSGCRCVAVPWPPPRSAPLVTRPSPPHSRWLCSSTSPATPRTTALLGSCARSPLRLATSSTATRATAIGTCLCARLAREESVGRGRGGVILGHGAAARSHARPLVTRRLILGPTGRPTGAGCYWYK